MQSKPKIVTASWSAKLPAEYAAIGISRGTPRGRAGYRRYRPLEPGPWFSSESVEEFAQLYNEILSALDAERVVRDLQELAGDRTSALLCWERPEPGSEWCHRAMVSSWLYDKLGLEVYELGLEHEGCGHAHPKHHLAMRRTIDA